MRNTIALTIAGAVTVALSAMITATVVQPDPTAVEYAMPAPAAVQPDATPIEYGL